MGEGAGAPPARRRRAEWGAPRGPGPGKGLFLFLPVTCRAGLCGAGKGELLGETRPGGVGGGEEAESLLAPLTRLPRTRLRARRSPCARRGGDGLAGTEARASRGRRAPRGDPRPRPRGVRGGASSVSRGRGGGGRPGSGWAEGLTRPAPEPYGDGTGAWGGGTGARLRRRDPASGVGRPGEVYSQGPFPGSCDVSKKWQRSPTFWTFVCSVCAPSRRATPGAALGSEAAW